MAKLNEWCLKLKKSFCKADRIAKLNEWCLKLKKRFCKAVRIAKLNEWCLKLNTIFGNSMGGVCSTFQTRPKQSHRMDYDLYGNVGPQFRISI